MITRTASDYQITPTYEFLIQYSLQGALNDSRATVLKVLNSHTGFKLFFDDVLKQKTVSLQDLRDLRDTYLIFRNEVIKS